MSRGRARRRRVERHDDHWRWIGGPVPPGSAGMTLGPLVIVRRRAAESGRLMRHELVHVRQWREKGAIRFAVEYVWSYLRWRARGYSHHGAYRRIPAEVEAYWLERREQPPPR